MPTVSSSIAGCWLEEFEKTMPVCVPNVTTPRSLNSNSGNELDLDGVALDQTKVPRAADHPASSQRSARAGSPRRDERMRSP